MFFQGLLLGFSIALPVGPIGLLCLQRTLAHGRVHGFVSGLGAATADALYGLVAALGLTAVTAWLQGWQFWLHLGGGLFLLALAVRTFTAPPAANRAAAGPSRRPGLGGAFASVFVLTVANPATILSFLAVFAALGVVRAAGRSTGGLALVAGVFLGSATWWLLLSLLAGRLRPHVGDRGRRFVNRLAGLSLLGLAAWSLFAALRSRLG